MTKKYFNTPILFIIFNRPEYTRKVFKQIRSIKPRKLFIAADGPRKNKLNEYDKCIETRKITELIDWKCDVKRLYRNKNMGCGKAVSGAISWFFKNVDKGIIIEDDCLPDKSFFSYCEEMLEKYEDDSKVFHISGDNFLNRKMNKKDSYYYSKYPHVWGWATWKRSWDKYDYNMKKWKLMNWWKKIKLVSGTVWEKVFWYSNFELVTHKVVDTWDYQWVYTVFSNNGVSVVPTVNLVSNIGFGVESTHTKNNDQMYANLEIKEIRKPYRLMNRKYSLMADTFEYDYLFKFKSIKTLATFIYSLFVIKLRRL